MLHPFHHLDAALPGLSASGVIMAANSAKRTYGLGPHRTIRAVLAPSIAHNSDRDYNAALAFIAGFIAPAQLGDLSGGVPFDQIEPGLTAAINCAEAVLAVRNCKKHLPIEAFQAIAAE